MTRNRRGQGRGKGRGSDNSDRGGRSAPDQPWISRPWEETEDDSEQGATAQGTSRQGGSERDTSSKRKGEEGKAPGQGTSRRGASGQGTSGQGRSERDTSRQGRLRQGASGQGTSGQGRSEQDTSRQGELRQGASRQDTSAQGTSVPDSSQQDISEQGVTGQGRTFEQCAPRQDVTGQETSGQGRSEQTTAGPYVGDTAEESASEEDIYGQGTSEQDTSKSDISEQDITGQESGFGQDASRQDEQGISEPNMGDTAEEKTSEEDVRGQGTSAKCRQQQQQQQQQTKLATDSNAASGGEGSTASIPAPTEAQKEMANNATVEYEKGNMAQCLNLMNKLNRQRGIDPKVVHNLAVVNFYLSNQCGVEELKNGLNAACQLAKNSEDPLDGIEDVENAVLYYNQAVHNFILKQHRTALAILDRGFQYIEPPDEALAQNVLLLWTELHLCVAQPDKALRVLGYLEKGVTNGKSGQGSGTPERGEQGGDSSDSLRTKISLFKTRCLAMMKSLKSCKREIKTLSNSCPGLTGLAVQYVRAYFEYLRGNGKKSLKILMSMSTNGIPSVGQSLTTMFHNNLACIYLQLRKPVTATSHLRMAYEENAKAMKEIKATPKGKPIQYIAIGRQHELMYNLGIQLLFCSKPVEAFEPLIMVIQVYQTNPRLWLRIAECCIMYHRQSNDDDAKLERRQQVIQGSVGSGFHRKLIIGPGTGQDKPRGLSSNNPPATPALTMEFAAMCLTNALDLLPLDPLDVAEVPPAAEENDTNKVAEPSLVPAPPASPMRPVEVANLRCSILASSAYVSLCLNDYLVALKHAQNLMRQPRLSGAQRYCGNMYMSEALVAMDRVADAIGHLSPDNLTPADINTIPPEVKTDPEKIDKNDKGDRDAAEGMEDKSALVPWIPRDVLKARAFMQHNLAAAHATRTEYDKASKYLNDASTSLNLLSQNTNVIIPVPAQMYYLKLYLDLMQGNRQSAQGVIKDHFGHVTPNRAK